MWDSASGDDFPDDDIFDLSAPFKVSSDVKPKEMGEVKKKPDKDKNGEEEPMKVKESIMTTTDGDKEPLEGKAKVVEAEHDFVVPQTPRNDDPNTRKRLFPGPAGMIAPTVQKRKKGSTSFLANKLEAISRRKKLANKRQSEDFISGETNGKFFRSNSWKEMLHNYNVTDENNSLMHKYNVAWIKNKSPPRLITKKCPILHCVLKKIDLTTNDPTCVFIDKSGTLDGMIHRKAMEAHRSYFRSGAVLVLKNVQIIMTDWNCYMVVTEDNLVDLYLSIDDVTRRDKVCILDQSDINRMCDQAAAYEQKMIAALRSQNANGTNSMLSSTPIPKDKNKSEATSECQNKYNFNSKSLSKFLTPNTKSQSQNNSPILQKSSNMPNENVFEGIDEDSIFGDF